MDNIEKRGKFKSNFGFLMASIGSAVGLGNLWGFPYKMGKGGGFAFLLLYVVMVVCIGYCLQHLHRSSYCRSTQCLVATVSSTL